MCVTKFTFGLFCTNVYRKKITEYRYISLEFICSWAVELSTHYCWRYRRLAFIFPRNSVSFFFFFGAFHYVRSPKTHLKWHYSSLLFFRVCFARARKPFMGFLLRSIKLIGSSDCVGINCYQSFVLFLYIFVFDRNFSDVIFNDQNSDEKSHDYLISLIFFFLYLAEFAGNSFNIFIYYFCVVVSIEIWIFPLWNIQNIRLTINWLNVEVLQRSTFPLWSMHIHHDHVLNCWWLTTMLYLIVPII